MHFATLAGFRFGDGITNFIPFSPAWFEAAYVDGPMQAWFCNDLLSRITPDENDHLGWMDNDKTAFEHINRFCDSYRAEGDIVFAAYCSASLSRVMCDYLRIAKDPES